MTIISRRSAIAGLAGVGAAGLVGRPSIAQDTVALSAPFGRAISYVRQIGDLEVTTLLDGYFLLEQQYLTGLSPDELTDGLNTARLDPAAALPLPIAVHLIRRGSNLILLDAGAGTSLGDTAGKFTQMLAAVGVAPSDINQILISHMHPDHIGGMLQDNAVTFPNASVRIATAELEFWTNQENAASAPEALSSWFSLAGAVTAAYQDRIETFAGEADLGNGLSAMPTPGHTVGHTAYRVDAGKEQLLLWGDSTSLASLQFSHPDSGIAFDTDSAVAAVTRRRVLDMAVRDNLLVAATHLPFPGFGYVDQRDDAYAWVPEEWKLF
jgi:glyoxylase-like metal-dependent hydrolase (beta-lactamase superfamily II)